ncbi:MAG: hypothetical protein JXB85_16410 [Anaerolineales bacterium]|nr:hypothetical protein [Anaerolineales bacterium]
MSSDFWSCLDQLLAAHEVVIDRPVGTAHPRYPEVIYPLDYGFLEGTTAGDGGGIDVWCGASGERLLVAVILTVDLHKRDTEIKLALGCDNAELQTILDFHGGNSMGATLMRRPLEAE